jgi:L-amino acid N-acyltransferase YncA
MTNHEIVSITPDNMERFDLFCHKSKAKEKGYQEKLAWYKERFKEGLRIKLLRVDEGKKEPVSRGFIEYIPAENGWRVVNALGYMLIHCIWVVGKHKNKGYGSKLLESCIKNAEEKGKKGVAVVTSKGNWLPNAKIFTRHGFSQADAAPPAFDLMVKKFKSAPDPFFPSDWEERLGRYPKGLTVFLSRQCPYTEDAVRIVLEAAQKRGIKTQVVELKSS